MCRKLWCVVGLCSLAMATLWAAPAGAQMAEVKEKPPMYTYAADWAIPRAQWADVEKVNASEQKMLETSLANGTLVGFGNDVNLIHQPDEPTHDSWWSAMSMAGVLNLLDQAYKSGTATNPVFVSATKHSDTIFVSRFYNWHSGSWKGAYTHGASYKLKPDAPDDAVETLSKSFIVPLMEKLLADGTIFEYEVDTQAIHSQAPGMFWLFYLTPNAEGLDKANAALQEALKANPLAGPSVTSMVDFTAHRDELARTNATYK